MGLRQKGMTFTQHFGLDLQFLKSYINLNHVYDKIFDLSNEL